MPNLADLIVAVTGDLGPLRAAAQSGGQEAGQTAATGFQGKFSAGIKVAAAAAGALMVAGLAGAISRGNTTALLAAQVGASGPEMGRLGKVSGALFASGYGESVEAVNEALKAVITNGLAGVNSSEADLKRVAGNVSNLTALMGEDAGRVSAAIQQMLRTGMARTAEEAFDILTKATQGGINKSEDLLDTINEYGTQFRQLGLDGPTAMGLISQAIQAGARDSDTAADALKEFAIRAQDGSKLSADALTKLGLSAKDTFDAVARGGPTSAAALGSVLEKLKQMPPSAERTALAVALFGTKAEDLGDALFAMDLSKARKEFGDFEGAAKSAGDTLAGSAGAQVETFKRQITEGLINAMARAIPVLQSTAGWVQRNADVIGPLAAVVGTFAITVWAVNAAMTAYAAIQAAVAALHLVDLGRWIARTAALVGWTIALYAVRVATIAWTAVQWLLNVALTANPIGLVVAAIAILIGIIVLIATKTTWFQDIWGVVWGFVKSAAQAVADWFMRTLWPSLKVVIDLVVGYWKFMANAAIAAFKFLIDGVKGYWNFLRDFTFEPLRHMIMDIIPDAFRKGVGFIGAAWETLKAIARAPVDFFINTIVNRGIIGTFNAVAGFIPGLKKLDEIHPAGFARGGRPGYDTGGQLPGYSDVDNMVALGPDGEPLALAGGEWVINPRQSKKHGGLLAAINSGIDGFAGGGIIGAIMDPAGWVKDRVNGLINGIPGGGFMRDVLVGLGGKIVNGLIEFVKSKLSFGGGPGAPGAGFLPWPSSPSAQRGDTGMWRNIWAIINSTGPMSGSFGNAYRPGDRLWHGSGRALDWMGFNQDGLASFFMARIGNVLELIHRTNTRDYAVTRGVNKGSFNNTLMEQHRNHIHIAMADGGLLARVFDTGGILRPGMLAANTGSRNELVTPEGMPVSLTDETIDKIVNGFARVMMGGAATMLQLGRTR